jgi:hypothetical protein
VVIWTKAYPRGLIVDRSLFGILAFRGLQSRKTRLAYTAESRNAKRCLVVWPVIMINDHTEVGKREELACAKPRRISGILSLEKRKKKLLCRSGVVTNWYQSMVTTLEPTWAHERVAQKLHSEHS